MGSAGSLLLAPHGGARTCFQSVGSGKSKSAPQRTGCWQVVTLRAVRAISMSRARNSQKTVPGRVHVKFAKNGGHEKPPKNHEKGPNTVFLERRGPRKSHEENTGKCQKILAPIKIKSALPPPPNPSPKRRNFMDMVFPAERTHFSRRP